MKEETEQVASNYVTKSPVLFLIFNRPDTTRQVFEAIRAAKPPKLYIAADGPRSNRPGEAARCEEARKIATAVDWDCEVKTLFRNENLGCGKAVSQAITWYFEQEPEGIILEDDCLPDPTFFRYIDELLLRYRNDSRVAVISGDNLQTKPRRDANSYYFSLFNHVWGWASWRRAWVNYDFDIASWPQLGDRLVARALTAMFDEVREKGDSFSVWDYQWTFTCWREGMISILPAVNLVKNIGFGEDATHTTGDNSNDVSSRTRPLEFPLRHPVHMIVDSVADNRFLSSLVLNGAREKNLVNRSIRRVMRLLRQGIR